MSDLPRLILAPYMPTPTEVVERLLDVAGVHASDCVYDLGCGDGRVVIAAAQLRGARGVGVDIEPYWVEQSQRNAVMAGVAGRVQFTVQDALTVDLTPATVVFLYLVEWSTQLLAPLIAKQVAPGTRLLSLSFPLVVWPAASVITFPDAAGQQRTLYLWVKEGRPAPDGGY